MYSIVGCKIPADMRMIEMLSTQLRVDQAILTGMFTYQILKQDLMVYD